MCNTVFHLYYYLGRDPITLKQFVNAIAVEVANRGCISDVFFWSQCQKCSR